MNKALILMSGGQDSTTCLYWAKKKFDSIQAIGFNYGQRHVIELDFAKKICDKENISFDIISLKEILSNSALINPQEDLNKKGIQIYESNRGGEITYHGPGPVSYTHLTLPTKRIV